MSNDDPIMAKKTLGNLTEAYESPTEHLQDALSLLRQENVRLTRERDKALERLDIMAAECGFRKDLQLKAERARDEANRALEQRTHERDELRAANKVQDKNNLALRAQFRRACNYLAMLSNHSTVAGDVSYMQSKDSDAWQKEIEEELEGKP